MLAIQAKTVPFTIGLKHEIYKLFYLPNWDSLKKCPL